MVAGRRPLQSLSVVGQATVGKIVGKRCCDPRRHHIVEVRLTSDQLKLDDAQLLKAEDIDLPGAEGAKYGCSPPPRDKRSQEAVWAGLKDGTLGLYSSDHASCRFDTSGKLPIGEKTVFKEMANGVPGIELRMPLLFSEGVSKGRIAIHEFFALTASNHARIYGLADRERVECRGPEWLCWMGIPTAREIDKWIFSRPCQGYRAVRENRCGHGSPRAEPMADAVKDAYWESDHPGDRAGGSV